MRVRGLLTLAVVATHAAAAHTVAAAPGAFLSPARGETEIVGRAVVSAGALGDGAGTFYVWDGTRGVRVLPASGRWVVAAGDSVRVRGRLQATHGLRTLVQARVETLAAGRRAPAPVPIGRPDWETLEGRLAVADGVVAAHSRVPAGTSLTLALGSGEPVVVFAFADRPGGMLDLERFNVGDRVRVTGVVGQFDRSAPYTGGYQLYPRHVDDVAHRGVPLGVYPRVALGALALLLAALAWAVLLRRQVARHVAALRGSEDRYRGLVERASDAVIVHDLGGQIVELNHAAWNALGRAAGPPPALADCVDSSAAANLAAHLRALATDGHARTDLCIARPSGETVLFEFESATVTLDGQPRVLSLARDVDARRAHERALDAAREAAECARAEAEESARLKSAFLASMSHEIRTPLTAVIGFAELLRDEVNDEQRELADAIEGGGRRLLATLNSVLDLARLDAGGRALAPRALDVAAHVRHSLTLLRSLATRRALALAYDGPASLTAVLDEGALDRVLVNLVGNALKFTETGGVTVALARDGEALVLTVSDTGIGMDAAFLPHVFSEFRQESEGERRSHEGSGLGMALTHRLVHLMEGTIGVESCKGVGSTFTVRLPLAGPGAPGRGNAAGAEAAVPELAAR